MKPDPKAAIVVTVVIVLIGLWYGGIVSGSTESQTMGESICTEQFGQDWSYNGYMATYPPSVQCEGPNGTIGVAPMPEEMQQEIGIVTPNESEEHATDEPLDATKADARKLQNRIQTTGVRAEVREVGGGLSILWRVQAKNESLAEDKSLMLLSAYPQGVAAGELNTTTVAVTIYDNDERVVMTANESWARQVENNTLHPLEWMNKTLATRQSVGR